jgi:hypothetical protein
MPFRVVRLLDNRLGHTSRELLTQLPDRLAHLSSGRFGLGQLGLQLVKPVVKALMELLAQDLAMLTCTYIVSGDNLCSTSHGEPSLVGGLSRYS